MRATAIVVLILQQQQQPELQRRKKSLLLRPTDRPSGRMQTSSFESGTSFAPSVVRKVEMEGRGRLVTDTLGQIVVRFGECNAF